MMFSSLVLLGCIALFSFAAAETDWLVAVGNTTGGTLFTPNVVVSQVSGSSAKRSY